MSARPFFTVVVPTRDRPRPLAFCLASLACLSYPRERFEVVVVDDGSATPMQPALAAVADRIEVRLVSQPHSGPAIARNTGVRHARGEFVAFTDDDCAPAPDWLAHLADRLATAPDQAVGGRTVNALAGNRYSEASQSLITFLCAYYNQAAADRPASPGARFLTTSNLSLPVAQFRAVGGFDPAFRLAAAEDRDLCDRWLQRGYRLTYAPEACVYHSHALGARSFWRQHFNYGRGAFTLSERRSERGQRSLHVEPLHFYAAMLRHAYRAGRGGRGGWWLAGLTFASQAANAAGFFREAGLSRSARHARARLGILG